MGRTATPTSNFHKPTTQIGETKLSRIDLETIDLLNVAPHHLHRLVTGLDYDIALVLSGGPLPKWLVRKQRVSAELIGDKASAATIIY